MSNSGRDRTQAEIERLRKALDAETLRCRDLQRELDRSTGDFEEFVTTAAHNLRESLREVAAFSQLMAETYTGRLDTEANVVLGRIQNATARMQSLLADVVDYWATDAGDRQAARTDMQAVLHQALLATEKQITERGAIVTHDPLPAVMGDFEILTKVLHHLIRNAIEFCGTPPPRLHISSKREDLEWLFSVQDNGPGIAQAFHDRVFGVFKRLHGKEHPGSGLGLAFCRKAIQWHAGRMWIESAPGAGTTFYFTLPPAD